MNTKVTILLSIAALLFCTPPLMAQSSPDKTKLKQFLDQAAQGNREEIAPDAETVKKAGENLPLKSFGSMLKADHRVNQEAVESLAATKNVSLSEARKKTSDAKLLHMTGDQFAAELADSQIKDRQTAIQKFQTAESEFQSDPQVEMYIKQTLPVPETHLKEAQLLKQHLDQQQKTARE